MLIPIVAHPLGLNDLFFIGGLSSRQMQLKEALVKYFNSKYVFLFNSGTSSFFMLLEALKMFSEKKEVIIPAYTASALVVAIKKAGLRPVLGDISLKDFNIDLNALDAVISQNTLCIVVVHMFGITSEAGGGLKQRYPQLPLIEDCCQALGNSQVGCLGDASFYSFNRGKNLPTYGGGCIATNNEAVARNIAKLLENIPDAGVIYTAAVELKLFALALAMRPFWYGLLSPVLKNLKERPTPEDFSVKRYTDYQAAVALSLLRRIKQASRLRYYNGMLIMEALKDIDSLILPNISVDSTPAFNRLPIVFKDLKKLEKVERSLRQIGIETSRMYYMPLHHLFDLGYKKDDFPNACYFAQHLLTVPVHPLVTEKDLGKIIEVIKKAVK
ncbi:MAG: DegT/DnrJ/EryC1/StrS family aminotransferase [Candidatus Omnitrophica bacterium]|nr:DegT/DnrJ/EryC1/StrS family aminotransferase [Candidatus Omnitrophota bacterium]